MKEELKQFGIDIEDIKESNELLDNISEAIHQMSLATMKDRFEVVLNNNLIETKDKYTGFRTILGCRISYDNLPKDVSFIVREDTKPTYEELQNQLQQKENIIKEVREWAKKYSCQFTNDDGELVVSEISFNIQARPCDLFKILDKEAN